MTISWKKKQQAIRRVATAKRKRQQHHKRVRGYHEPVEMLEDHKPRGRFTNAICELLGINRHERLKEIERRRERHNRQMSVFCQSHGSNVTVKRMGCGLTRLRTKTGNHFNFAFMDSLHVGS